MATLNTTNIKHGSSSSNNIVLASDGKVTFPQNTGNILQVKQTVVTSGYSEAINVGAASSSCGLDVSITPSSTSNKILVLGVANVANSDSIETSSGVILFRGGSAITGALGTTVGNRIYNVSSQSYTENAGYSCQAIPIHFLDSPSSTSAQTYSIRLVYHTTSSTETIYLNRTRDDDNQYYRGRAMSSITVMEVAA